ncbi:unnamed protein product [Leuciscus chuanchicus]
MEKKESRTQCIGSGKYTASVKQMVDGLSEKGIFRGIVCKVVCVNGERCESKARVNAEMLTICCSRFLLKSPEAGPVLCLVPRERCGSGQAAIPENDPFSPEVEEEEVEMGSGARRLSDSHCEDLGSGAVKLPLSHNSPKGKADIYLWWSKWMTQRREKRGQQDKTASDGEEKYIYSWSFTTGLLKTTEVMDPPETRLPQSY